MPLHRHPRQVNRIAHGLLDQIEGIDQHAEVGQAAGPELGEVGDPQGDRLVRIQRGQRIAHHRGGRIHPQHDRFAVEAMDADVFGNLPDDFGHGRFAAARSDVNFWES